MNQLETSVPKKAKKSRIYYKGVNESHSSSFSIITPIHIYESIITLIFTVVTTLLKR